jgi:peptide/nickel transport system substrate-binding protein
MVGSGPYRFLKDEFVSGSRVVYAKFDGYVPRKEPADMTAGGKRAFFDRVEWRIIPDAGTAAAALQAGEVDWWDYPAPDLLPVLRSGGMTVAPRDPFGAVSALRFNSLNPPFNNVRLRRAILEAIEQHDYMQVLVGNAPGAYRTCYAMFACGPSNIREIGSDIMKGPRNLEKSRAAIRAAGYAGEKVVIVSPTDFPTIGPHGPLTADLLKKLGMNVELQETDWGTMLQRRNSMEPVERGGWSIFHTWKPGIDMGDPTGNQYIRGEGKKGYAGWFESERIEKLANEWISAKTVAAADAVLDEMQRVAFEEVPFVPLGQWKVHTAYSKSIVDVIPFVFSLFWNVRRL